MSNLKKFKKGDRMAVLVDQYYDYAQDHETDAIDLMDGRIIDLDRNYHTKLDHGVIAVLECVKPTGGYFETIDREPEDYVPGLWKLVTE